MIALSPYATLVVIVLLVVAVGVLLLCHNAMRSGSRFEGEIGNRLISMKIRTDPPQVNNVIEADRVERDGAEPARRGPRP